ncbi:MAG: hypothetical protein K0R05_4805 [Anaerocolumna sp.]|jgi:hypothetical protein|nr:hypothetical protein [Clostridia bacterium]MDF2873230.1 hypothetical protein [Anaerocolumna sp.]
MKKLISIACAGLLMISLAGCSNQIAEVQANTTSDKNQQSIEAKDSSLEYSTTRQILEVTSKNTKIYYPKLQGYKGELSMDYMNQSIKQLAESFVEGADYTDVQLDYEVKRIDEKVVSILFKGTGKLSGSREINIQKSVNLDVKSTNPIVFENFIKQDESSRAEVAKLLDVKAKNAGITTGFEAEGIFIYFEGDIVVFYYMPLDDSAKDWVELSVPLSELDGFINTEFGEHPAS